MPIYPKSEDFENSGGSGSVTSVNGQQGDVVLTANSLGAQPNSQILTDIASINMPNNSILLTNSSGNFTPTACTPAATAWLSYTTVDQQKSHLALAEVASTGDYLDLTNTPTSFLPSAHTHTISEVAGLQSALNSKISSGSTISSSQITGLSTVATTGSYNDLTAKPLIPTSTDELENNSGYITASQAPVISVAGKDGAVSLDASDISGLAVVASSGSYNDLSDKPTIPTVNYPVTSVNTKTGAVVLTNTDIGAAATVHTHAIGDVTNLQTTLDSKANLSALANYATTSSLSTTLSGYVTNSSLTTTLGGYATTTALTTGLAGKFNTPSGSTTQYIRGDGSLAAFPTIPTVPTNVSAFTNDAGYLTTVTSGQISTALGYTPYNGTTNPNGYVTQAGARTAISLTTTGTSGAATYNSTTGVLNIPNYANSGGTITSVTAGTGLSGGTITTTGTISMPNVGTAGTYSGNITTDAQGRVTGGTNRSFTNPTRSLNTSFQISTTQDAIVSYAVDIACSAAILAGQAGRVILEYANETGFTTGVTTVNQGGASAGGVLNLATLSTATLTGVIPAGKFVRLRTVNTTGTPTFTYQSAQEVLLG